MVNWNFVCLGLCSFPCYLSLGTTEKSLAIWLHHYTSPFRSHQALINIDSLNLLSSRLNSLSSLRPSSYPPDAPLPQWTYCNTSPSVARWRTQHCTKHSKCVSPVLSKEESPPLTCWQRSGCISGLFETEWSVFWNLSVYLKSECFNKEFCHQSLCP